MVGENNRSHYSQCMLFHWIRSRHGTARNRPQTGTSFTICASSIFEGCRFAAVSQNTSTASLHLLMNIHELTSTPIQFTGYCNIIQYRIVRACVRVCACAQSLCCCATSVMVLVEIGCGFRGVWVGYVLKGF